VSAGFTDKCHELGPELTSWNEIDPLPGQPRSGQRSSVIGNQLFHFRRKLWS